MSIRTRLLMTHLLMIAASAALMALFVYLLFHAFAGQLEDIRSRYNLDGVSSEEVVHGELTAVAELQLVTLNDPDRLLDDGVMDGYAERLAARNIGIALLKDGALRYVSAGADERWTRALPVYPLGPGETHVFRAESLQTDGRWVAGLQAAFRYGDGSPGHLFLLLDAEPVGRLAGRLLPLLALAFLAAIALAGTVMTVWVSRRILKPVERLRQAAELIREGRLEHPVDIPGRDELAELGRAFEDMRLRLQESVRERLKMEENRKRLMAGIAHDLKTPVAAITGYAEGLLDGVAADPGKAEQYLRTIHSRARDLDRLIDELFLYSKLDLNRVPFHFTDLDLNGFVERVAEEARLRLERDGIRLDVERPPEPVVVRADPGQLARVFANLIENGAKSMDKPEKRLRIRVAPPAAGDGDAAPRFVRVDISDNGAGIAPDDLPRIFEAFYRGNASRAGDGAGSGLGLAIARQIVCAHGGNIRADSELGKGTVISFTLPEAGRSAAGERGA